MGRGLAVIRAILIIVMVFLVLTLVGRCVGSSFGSSLVSSHKTSSTTTSKTTSNTVTSTNESIGDYFYQGTINADGSYGSGDYVVGKDIQPGIYRVSPNAAVKGVYASSYLIDVMTYKDLTSTSSSLFQGAKFFTSYSLPSKQGYISLKEGNVVNIYVSVDGTESQREENPAGVLLDSIDSARSMTVPATSIDEGGVYAVGVDVMAGTYDITFNETSYSYAERIGDLGDVGTDITVIDNVNKYSGAHATDKHGVNSITLADGEYLSCEDCTLTLRQ